MRRDKAGTAANQGVEAGAHLLFMEGFDHVVIGPSLQTGHLVLPVTASGEDQDGKRDLLGAQLTDQTQAIHIGQAEIDDADVDGIILGEVQSLLRLVGRIHLV